MVTCVLENLLAPPIQALPPAPSPFIQEDVDLFIQNLQPGKSPGRDKITDQAIQAGGPMLAEAICSITNSCLEFRFSPSNLKSARTAILRKPHKPDYADPTAYRPIDLLSCLGQVVETVIARRSKSQTKSRAILPPWPLQW